MIQINVEDIAGNIQLVEIPEDVDSNLMETLKTYNYDFRATCGGMGLCSDCHCRVREGLEILPEAEEQELITLESRPDAMDDSRLACQIKVGPRISGISIKIMGAEN